MSTLRDHDSCMDECHSSSCSVLLAAYLRCFAHHHVLHASAHLTKLLPSTTTAGLSIIILQFKRNISMVAFLFGFVL